MTTTNISAASPTDPTAKNIDIQVITQKDFEGMNLARQQFIRDRIAAGQVKIVSREDITPPPSPTPAISVNLKKLQKSLKIPENKIPNKQANHKDQTKDTKPARYPPNPPASAIPTIIGKPVKLSLTTGKTRIGVITSIYQYDIILETTDGPIIILKHAITAIEEDKKSGPTQITDNNTQ